MRDVAGSGPQDLDNAGLTATRTGSPVGAGFVGFTVAIFLLVAVTFVDGMIQDFPRSASAVGRLGVVATTIYVLAALVAAWRLTKTRNRSAGSIAVAYLMTAAWCWRLSAESTDPSQLLTFLVTAVAAAVAASLLIEGLRLAFWLEVFGGLGLVAVVLSTALVGSEPAAWSGSVTLALLVTSGGMSCLYGGLVDVEMAERRNLVELLDARQRIESEVRRAEEVLHDLRSGLLAIESAIGSFDGDLAEPLRSEAARLRRLTVRSRRATAAFDLAEKVRHQVNTRQAGGATVDLTGPNSAWVWGEESEVLAIVDNLLSNAERHGENTPIRVDISTTDDRIKLSVTNGGPGVGDLQGAFTRGTTTHPQGEGIGLDRAQTLAQLNRALLAHEPSDDGLTTFTLEFDAQPPVLA